MSDKKVETLAERFKKFFLSEEKQETTETKLETATLEDGTTIEAEAFEVGQPVLIVTGEEKLPAPAGEITLDDGRVLVINEEGAIAEIKEAGAEELAEEQLSIEDVGNALLKINDRLKALEEKETLSKEDLETAKSESHSLIEEQKKEIETLKGKITALSAKPAAKPNVAAPQSEIETKTMVSLSKGNARANIEDAYLKILNSK
jgi:hypothetical protein